MKWMCGFLLVGAGCALGACFNSGGDNDDAQSGFGVACSVDADCEAYSLMCDSVRGCVECVLNSHCPAPELCSAGICSAAGGCVEDRDCPAGVCATTAGVCVDCWRSSDCPTGEICVDLACTPATSCADSRDCPAGQVCDTAAGSCVECLSATDCTAGETCEGQICVPTPSGSTGAGGTTSTGTGGSSGGTLSTGSGGSVSSGGSGSGGTGNTCSCGAGLACTTGGDCVDPNVIWDAAYDCGDQIIPVAGRVGGWFGAADTGINLMWGISSPGTGWSDNTCAAWATGGPLETGTQYWALLGTTLAEAGAPYDLSAYTGIMVAFEGGGQDHKLVLRNPGDQYFQAVTAPTSGTEERWIYFSEFAAAPENTSTILDKSQIIQVHLSPNTTPSNFGFAIHKLMLF